MSGDSNHRRPRRGTYKPKAETLAALKVSGNPINGLGETTVRPPSPFFWHPPDKHPFGDLQVIARQESRKCPGAADAFVAAYQHPGLTAIAPSKNTASPEQLTSALTAFALAQEADAVGITAMDPLYVFEGYSVEEPWVVVLALAHNYERLKEVPSDETNGIGVCDVAAQYGRGTRSSFAVANWIREQGYMARAYPGPGADALSLIPPAIASGLGELGKHGSLISPQFGAGVRLAAVTTDMPLVPTRPVDFGADRFCQSCQICTRECPPDAIFPESRWCAALSAGMSISTSAFRIFRKRRLAESALQYAPGHGQMFGRSSSPAWLDEQAANWLRANSSSRSLLDDGTSDEQKYKTLVRKYASNTP